MERDPMQHDARKARRQRRVGHGKPCSKCGETDPRAFVRRKGLALCYECLAAEEGRSSAEAHHPAGRSNLPLTVMVPGNDHRILSDAQQDWPQQTLRNPDGSPLLKAAGAIRGWLDILRLFIERVIGWIPPFLEKLDAWLRERFGPGWWHLIEGAQP